MPDVGMASIRQDQAMPAPSVTPPATSPAATSPAAKSPAANPAAAPPDTHPNLARLRGPALGILSIALFILAWHLLTIYRVNLIIRFTNIPTPASVLASAQQAARDPDFVYDLIVSCQRIAIGFLTAAAIGVPVGLMMGHWTRLREFLLPLFEVLRPIPAIAWVPISIMMWPTNEESIVFITFLGSFFPILLNTLMGMGQVDPVLVRAARCLGARESSIFREVLLPAVLPQIFTGLAVGMGVAWVSLIAAEMIAGQFGIGYFTWEAYSLVEYPKIVLGMVCIGVLGLASSALIRLAGWLVMPWARLPTGKRT
jgi:NitT/TauT family transport system permease protein